ncbi:MAG: PglZ domain-containing protein [Acidimicrobiia bacterium]|nr:PglZ domain-containing protein [Acidimicrobiia bacterium]
MSVLRNNVADSLAKKVSAYGVVVWDDPEGSYVDEAPSLVREDVGFAAYAGSWYRLRREIEDSMGGSELPRLVVYVPVEPPAEDPLAEVRAATGLDRSFKLLLGTALRQSLEGQLTIERIEEVARSARTLTEAEEILEQGGGGPVLLTKRFGTAEPVEIMLRIACSGAGDVFSDDAFRTEVDRFLEQQLGGQFGGTGDLGTAIAQRLVAAELVRSGVATGAAAATPGQVDRAIEVLRRWQADRQRLSDLRSRMEGALEGLDLDALGWVPELAQLDSSPALDELALAHYLNLYTAGDYDQAAALAAVRRSSFWAKWDADLPWQSRWEIAHAASQLQALCLDSNATGAKPESVLADYEATTWQVDAEHRRLELGMTRLDELGDLEQPMQAARIAYEGWLDQYLRSFTAGVAARGLANGSLLRQGEVHDRLVEPYVRKGSQVAYFFVDALRYELGRELAASLQRAFGEDAVRVEGALGAAPSITLVGMANLCPNAHTALRLELDGREKLMVSIDGSPVMTPPERLSLLQAAHGHVVDIVLDDLVTQGESDLKERINGAKVVMVRSTEFDEAGEAGKLAVAHTSFPIIVEHLRRAVAKLSLAGVTRFVISSDHGFLILSRDVGQHRIIPKPGGKGEVHRRVFIGTGGAAGDELIRVPLSAVGIPGDLDLLVPRGLGLISAGGARGFFHGGISPQEMLVPVITVELEAAAGTEPLTVEVAISGKVTSRIFTGKLFLKSGLFSVEPIDVSVNAVRISDGAEIAKLVAAGGAEVAEGVVRLAPDSEALVSFQVIADLDKGDKVELRVMDVKTDRRIGRSKPAPVAAPVLVEADLDA